MVGDGDELAVTYVTGHSAGNPVTRAEGTGSVRVSEVNPYPYPAYPTHKPGQVLKPVTITICSQYSSFDCN